jgi:hypothetical protein
VNTFVLRPRRMPSLALPLKPVRDFEHQHVDCPANVLPKSRRNANSPGRQILPPLAAHEIHRRSGLSFPPEDGIQPKRLEIEIRILEAESPNNWRMRMPPLGHRKCDGGYSREDSSVISRSTRR